MANGSNRVIKDQNSSHQPNHTHPSKKEKENREKGEQGSFVDSCRPPLGWVEAEDEGEEQTSCIELGCNMSTQRASSTFIPPTNKATK